MNLKKALERIEALERKVKELEARPMQKYHTHYHNEPPVYQPLLPQPILPTYPFVPWQPTYGPQWWGAAAGGYGETFQITYNEGTLNA